MEPICGTTNDMNIEAFEKINIENYNLQLTMHNQNIEIHPI
ncbi:hypothetical protein [Wolbachia endosymbiont of Pentidionis agamae]